VFVVLTPHYLRDNVQSGSGRRIFIIREIMDSMTSTLSSENINGKELKVFKVLILGDSGTGKTALVRRSVHDFFTEGYRSTIGVDFSLKVLRWSEDLEIRLQMWDLAGQDRFNHLSRLYFNKAAGVLLVCDQSTEKSLEGIIKWKKELDSKLNDNIPAVIICNKEDIREPSKDSDDDLEIEEIARDLGVCAWTRTSAKTGDGVEEGIRTLVWQMLERENLLAYEGFSRSDSIITLTRPISRREHCVGMCWSSSSQ